ncbi:MAG: hypothetical protein GXO50_08480 [Chlorobi bacterium]|nr:hypothetical protein [Chlorobiota bacterium]
MHILIPALKEKFPETIIIAAEGISTGNPLHSALILGAHGISAETRFIASEEAPVSEEYKQAIIKSKIGRYRYDRTNIRNPRLNYKHKIRTKNRL